jgi:mannose-6-phosphate isomerase-like protein (cupin superfamily)
MTMTVENNLVRAGEGPVVSVVGTPVRVIVSSASTNGEYAILENVVQPGEGPPPHVHAREDEIFLVTRGRFRFWCAGETMELGAGDVFRGPKGVPHTFQNCGDTEGALHITSIPGGIDDFFAEFSDLGARPDFERAQEIGGRWGIQFLPPQ